MNDPSCTFTTRRIILALLTAAFALPMLWLITVLRVELTRAYEAVAAFLAQGPRRLCLSSCCPSPGWVIGCSKL